MVDICCCFWIHVLPCSFTFNTRCDWFDRRPMPQNDLLPIETLTWHWEEEASAKTSSCALSDTQTIDHLLFQANKKEEKRGQNFVACCCNDKADRITRNVSNFTRKYCVILRGGEMQHETVGLNHSWMLYVITTAAAICIIALQEKKRI